MTVLTFATPADIQYRYLALGARIAHEAYCLDFTEVTSHVRQKPVSVNRYEQFSPHVNLSFNEYLLDHVIIQSGSPRASRQFPFPLGIEEWTVLANPAMPHEPSAQFVIRMWQPRNDYTLHAHTDTVYLDPHADLMPVVSVLDPAFKRLARNNNISLDAEEQQKNAELSHAVTSFFRSRSAHATVVERPGLENAVHIGYELDLRNI